MDVVISRKANPMKEMECEIILCTQCKVIMGWFEGLVQGSFRGFLRYTRFEFKFWREIVFGLLRFNE